MAKVLISSLGTGHKKDQQNQQSREYLPTKYKFENEDKFYETSFVAAALSEHLQVDKLFLVGTSKSMWEEVYYYFTLAANLPFNNDYKEKLWKRANSFSIENPDLKMSEIELEEVNRAIDGYLKYINSSASGGSHCFIIDYGLNEMELWNNFDVFMRIGELLKQGDEIYLDITHAFRSIPLFNYLMLDLVGILKFNNKIKIGGLFYGMLETKIKLNEQDKQGYAPIVDLSPLYKITLWSRGAYDFINFGNGYLLAELFKDSEVKNDIGDFSDIVNINYIDDFKEKVDKLYDYIAKKEDDEPVLKYMKPILQDFTDRFKGINSVGELQLALSEWYFENKRFAQGYICLTESIITRILELYWENDKGIDLRSYDNREIIRKNLLFSKLKDHRNPEYRKVVKLYKKISRIRNTIAHAGYSRNRKLQIDIENSQSYFNDVKNLVFNNLALKNLPKLYPFSQL